MWSRLDVKWLRSRGLIYFSKTQTFRAPFCKIRTFCALQYLFTPVNATLELSFMISSADKNLGLFMISKGKHKLQYRECLKTKK